MNFCLLLSEQMTTNELLQHFLLFSHSSGVYPDPGPGHVGLLLLLLWLPHLHVHPRPLLVLLLLHGAVVARLGKVAEVVVDDPGRVLVDDIHVTIVLLLLLLQLLLLLMRVVMLMLLVVVVLLMLLLLVLVLLVMDVVLVEGCGVVAAEGRGRAWGARRSR